MSFSRLIKYKNINNVFNKTLINNINGSLSSLGMKNNYFLRSFATEKFERKLPSINIGTIGHVDHGKTTLSAAISKVMSEQEGKDSFTDFASIDKAPEEKARGITINSSVISYNTKERFVSHTDCPGHADFVKNMIVGISALDSAILLISASDGVMSQSREHVLLARQIGLEKLIVFINKVDEVDDEELLDLVELEARELLSEYGYDGDETPFIRGSALSALEGKDDAIGKERIIELMDYVDSYIPLPKRKVDGDFMLPIEGVYSIAGRGTVCTGNIERGKVIVGDELEIVGFNDKPIKTTVTGVETFKKSLDHGEAGDNVGLLLRGVNRGDIKRGMVVCKPGSQNTAKKFQAEIYVLSKDEGGRHTPFFSDYRPQFFQLLI